MKRSVALVIPVIVSAGLLFVPDAQAAPQNCKAWREGSKVVGSCDAGHGQWRLRADCRNQPDIVSKWVSPGERAVVNCRLGSPNSWSFETR